MIAALAVAGLAAALTVAPLAPAPKPCTDKVATMLHDAGFTGNKNRVAWAVTSRESNHRNLDESSPYYSGALGMFQVQTSAHSGKSWWSRAAMLDPATQARIVYRHMTNRGRDWSAWGLNSTGTAMDVSQYGGWSASQQHQFIWVGYQRGLSLYPERCAR